MRIYGALDILIHFAIVLQLSMKVSGLVCLSCQGVRQPRHCHEVEECTQGQYCSLQSYTDHFQDVYYDLQCSNKEYCPVLNTTSDTASPCTHCCNTDLCNAQGCGTPDVPDNSGPTCFNCKSIAKGGRCHYIDICDKNEVCYVSETEEFGDFLVDTGCKLKQVCHNHDGSSHGLGIVVGRRSAMQSQMRSLYHPLCTRCCSDDLCNVNCSSGLPNPTTINPIPTNVPVVADKDCLDIHNRKPSAPSGAYNVTIKNATLTVWCDMDKDGGGWTVFLKRFDGSVDFDRIFIEYQNGFGNIQGEFWLGLENIHQLTMGHNNTLRADIVAHNGSHQHDTIPIFNVGPAPLYVLHVKDPTGTTASGQMLYNDARPFTTRDVDRDLYSSGNCAVWLHGGFWYNACARTALPTSLYKPGVSDTVMRYYTGRGDRSIELKTRRLL